MSFPASFLDELIARSDIVDVVSDYVHLTKRAATSSGSVLFTAKRPVPSPYLPTSRSTTVLAAAKAAA